jgi:membrane protein DedA with SNARE-associated domain
MLAALLISAATNPYAQAAAIIGATFVLEDATTILVATLCANGTLDPALALMALVAGVALGDLGLYGLGALARTLPWVRRIAQTDRAERLGRWMSGRIVLTVVAARFTPGLRLPAYTACGFLRLPLRRFCVAVILSTLVWTSLLFALSYVFGAWTAQALGAWRWPATIALIVGFLVASRLVARRSNIARSAD